MTYLDKLGEKLLQRNIVNNNLRANKWSVLLDYDFSF